MSRKVIHTSSAMPKGSPHSVKSSYFHSNKGISILSHIVRIISSGNILIHSSFFHEEPRQHVEGVVQMQ